ncbi:GGDEF domain-containing protein [Sphingomonas oleivorans]|uniref:diguanylate cyclase n=1 Tax=Sphingomonas oleivorans TaxID=1735121 RepID=A0A2T5FY88_9SPHN|nr:GGDEF domain-containing protein [Sphingomonas oleivorans]PTQ11500.1 GGDEF domain-containing protein [Sphingomonas oleivorans]
MRFYRATTFLFPHSYLLRIFTICFIGTHVPLLSFIGWQIAAGNIIWEATALLTGASLIGTIATLTALGGLLSPIRAATEALTAYEAGRMVPSLPQGGPDLVGQLLNGINATVGRTESLVAKLADAANRDALTGLWNRRAFLEFSARLVEGGRKLAIALIDVDHFKKINDRLGHEEGDRVLREVAAVLQSSVRRTDMVARWGGEEFAILFTGEDDGNAAALLDRIRLRIESARIAEIDGQPLTFSGGVSLVQAGEASIEPGLGRADMLLYAAKHGGRNRLAVVGGVPS